MESFILRREQIERQLHIRILSPIVAGPLALSSASILEPLAHLGSPRLTLSARLLDEGPAQIATAADERACVEGLKTLARAAAKEGVDGLVIDCMADPGIRELRDLVQIPVFGPAGVAFGYASLSGLRFAVIVPRDVAKREVDEQVARLGLFETFAGSLHVKSRIAQGTSSRAEIIENLVAGCIEAIQEFNAGLIIPGCTSWTGLAPEVEERLGSIGLSARVIDPMTLSIRALDDHLRGQPTHQV